MFEPKVVCFLCKWCSYAGADLAGTLRMKYLPNGVVIRVMCSSRVDAQHVLEAFTQGADGVLICGCFPGECHYESGNYRTLARVTLLKRMMGDLGIDPDRLHLEWVCASCAPQYVETVNKFVDQLRELGPHAPAEEEPAAAT
jgi:F420-non-reducing hydrogenase iron-sulfur subunit